MWLDAPPSLFQCGSTLRRRYSNGARRSVVGILWSRKPSEPTTFKYLSPQSRDSAKLRESTRGPRRTLPLQLSSISGLPGPFPATFRPLKTLLISCVASGRAIFTNIRGWASVPQGNRSIEWHLLSRRPPRRQASMRHRNRCRQSLNPSAGGHRCPVC